MVMATGGNSHFSTTYQHTPKCNSSYYVGVLKSHLRVVEAQITASEHIRLALDVVQPV
jgi:hypothetical protein